MPVLAPAAIPALPTWPSLSDTETVFDTKTDAVGAVMPSTVTAINALGANVLNNAQYVEAQATAGLALASFKGAWSGLTGALNTPASVIHNGYFWLLLANLANVTTDQPGVTANWVKASIGDDQMGNISASVAANAMTITIQPQALDFRSATLGSGTLTRVRNAAAVTTVISSGSTGGTTNAVQSRIAVLALNNAGTIEAAWCNMAGASALSEEGLITTVAEGGAGAADSATTVYSTTARTNVAFRVLGYIESTQATAGTWATAPSKIQGARDSADLATQGLGSPVARGVSGLTGTNNSGTPTTQFDLSADALTLRDAAGGAVTRQSSTFTLTCNFSTAGPAANGRDQAGVFTASQFIRLFFIWNGATLATIASTAGPTTGPALPTGYTHWAYATTVRWNASSNIVPCYAQGAAVHYQAELAALSAGVSTTEAAVTLTSFAPSEAKRIYLKCEAGSTTAGTAFLKLVTGVTYDRLVCQANTTIASSPTVPNLAGLLYVVSAATTSLTINVQGYVVPNGDV